MHEDDYLSLFVLLFFFLLFFFLLSILNQTVNPINSEIFSDILQEFIILKQIFKFLLLLLRSLSRSTFSGSRCWFSSSLLIFFDRHLKSSLEDCFFVFHTFLFIFSSHIHIRLSRWYWLLDNPWRVSLSSLGSFSWSLSVSFFL